MTTRAALVGLATSAVLASAWACGAATGVTVEPIESDADVPDTSVSSLADVVEASPGPPTDDAPVPVCPVQAPSTIAGCHCLFGTVCITRPQSGGVAFLGCVNIPTVCGGQATCACMGCACGELGLQCKEVGFDNSGGSGTDLDCR